MDPNNQNQQLFSQTYAAAMAAGFDPSVFQNTGFATTNNNNTPTTTSQQQQSTNPQQVAYPTFPQFSSGVPTSHPQQQHLHQLNMQHAAVFQSGNFFFIGSSLRCAVISYRNYFMLYKILISLYLSLSFFLINPIRFYSNGTTTRTSTTTCTRNSLTYW